ncbi:MAG TPA: hypothetical protein VD837_09870 [Terriglobales bacterium]|nr:hypothetical protein [Terriglobales bacterium]
MKAGAITGVILRGFFAVILLCGPTFAQSQHPSSWNKVTEIKDATGSTVPTRIVESQREVNGRTIETRTVERLSINGGYAPSEQTETETVAVDPNTVRVIQRQYGRNADGSRTLIGVTEEERRASSDGGQSITRTRSSSDVNGRLSITAREVEQTVNTGDTQQTTTTLQTPDINAGFATSRKTVMVEQKRADGTTSARTQVLAPDANGAWQTNEVRERTMRERGAETEQEERIVRPDLNGNLFVTDRSVKREWKSADGTTHEQVQTYSNLVPGVAVDGKLRPLQQIDTISRKNPGGEQATERLVREIRPGSPADGLYVTGSAIEVTRPDAQGRTQTSRTVHTVSPSGGTVGVISFDSEKTTSSPGAVTVDFNGAPEDKKPTSTKAKPIGSGNESNAPR